MESSTYNKQGQEYEAEADGQNEKLLKPTINSMHFYLYNF